MIFTFFCEVLPREVRGRFMVVLAMFWMVGGIMIAAFAWGILSPNVRLNSFSIRITNYNIAQPGMLPQFDFKHNRVVRERPGNSLRHD